jgi:hypothetical protein
MTVEPQRMLNTRKPAPTRGGSLNSVSIGVPRQLKLELNCMRERYATTLRDLIPIERSRLCRLSAPAPLKEPEANQEKPRLRESARITKQ